MTKRASSAVRKTILKILGDGKPHSYGDLERKADTNWQTVRMHCDDLLFFDAAKLSSEGKVIITKHGLELLKKIRNES